METRDRYGEMQGERVNQGSVIGAAYTHVMQVQKSATTRKRARCHWVTRRSRHHAEPRPPSVPCRSHGVRGGASAASAACVKGWAAVGASRPCAQLGARGGAPAGSSPPAPASARARARTGPAGATRCARARGSASAFD
jgi:hypothetical protein